jgi:ABC-type uncharacterized transport system ATPase subunit
VLTPQETEELFRVLRALKAEGTTVILITHKLREVLDVTDDVTVMRGGRVVESGPVDDIFGAPREAYTRNLLQAVPGENPLLAAAL